MRVSRLPRTTIRLLARTGLWNSSGLIYKNVHGGDGFADEVGAGEVGSVDGGEDVEGD